MRTWLRDELNDFFTDRVFKVFTYSFFAFILSLDDPVFVKVKDDVWELDLDGGVYVKVIAGIFYAAAIVSVIGFTRVIDIILDFGSRFRKEENGQRSGSEETEENTDGTNKDGNIPGEDKDSLL